MATARSALAAAVAWLACASAPAADPPAVPAAAPAPGALVVELVFGADADLDLYVSDPAHETAYFANTPVRSGGEHVRDLRCDDPAPRVEVVRWPAPPPGRYRIGVDFPERCRDGIERAPYRIRVQAPDGSQEIEGEARFGRFDALVLDFEIGR
ncbi:MAG TPA: hypothetical protein VFY49_04890 [Myxococcota bacterium]|nr:hypothetical protein [Myxococcota bacterium]